MTVAGDDAPWLRALTEDMKLVPTIYIRQLTPPWNSRSKGCNVYSGLWAPGIYIENIYTFKHPHRHILKGNLFKGMTKV